ncbi:MAG: FRG domain-containing protein [Bacteroidota bacterium]|nr:FRG domain-containing protein [Bacteroidota bacterium]
MEVVKEIYLNTWEEYVELFKNFNSDKKEYIFRGQSNAVDRTKKFQKWELISSFNRNHFKLENYSFHDYLSQHFDSGLFKMYYGKYEYEKIDFLTEISLLEKCYFFQHYGIETCFIDFTFDPLIALYFSLASVQGTSGGKFDLDGNPLFYSEETDRDFVSIYQIDVSNLLSIIGIKEIKPETFSILNLDDYLIYPTRYSSMSANVGLDLEPKSTKANNYNLAQQKGCFLYYDNEDFQDSFEKFLKLFVLDRDIKLSSSIIKVYNINYNSLFKKMRSRNHSHIPLFRFLREKELTGQYLFNDIQGLKFDFNFFHNQ